ncbi:hypothetical protein [Noviherbaspirillum aridicola]|uniref:Transcriptional regulator n=1 Tax=Noviherbaspirillum aridicola TaxID=2849687 RepID=A0ABQ4Q7Y3_9BURK|nr:hypothetical protein [Noviherbaspirillum aridicola]GIZ52819.1 hypothetical protein NCCP691_28330 [Noviherbaspirillum aridicola]
MSDLTPPAAGERQAFARRLIEALQRAHYPADSPTRLAREFNLRFNGKPITGHAARKWLLGESIPTQDKIRIIAAWLDVPAPWLRFGVTEEDPAAREDARSKYDALLADLESLDHKYQGIVFTLVRKMARMSGLRSTAPGAGREDLEDIGRARE